MNKKLLFPMLIFCCCTHASYADTIETSDMVKLTAAEMTTNFNTAVKTAEIRNVFLCNDINEDADGEFVTVGAICALGENRFEARLIKSKSDRTLSFPEYFYVMDKGKKVYATDTTIVKKDDKDNDIWWVIGTFSNINGNEFGVHFSGDDIDSNGFLPALHIEKTPSFSLKDFNSTKVIGKPLELQNVHSNTIIIKGIKNGEYVDVYVDGKRVVDNSDLSIPISGGAKISLELHPKTCPDATDVLSDSIDIKYMVEGSNTMIGSKIKISSPCNQARQADLITAKDMGEPIALQKRIEKVKGLGKSSHMLDNQAPAHHDL